MTTWTPKSGDRIRVYGLVLKADGRAWGGLTERRTLTFESVMGDLFAMRDTDGSLFTAHRKQCRRVVRRERRRVFLERMPTESSAAVCHLEQNYSNTRIEFVEVRRK